jgi:hypothetical protein
MSVQEPARSESAATVAHTKATDKAVVVVDLSRYSDSARELEQHVGAPAVRELNAQIQGFIASALKAIGLAGYQLPYKNTGDGAIIALDTAEQASRFAEALHQAAHAHNLRKEVPLAQRHFRVGIWTDAIILNRQANAEGQFIGFEMAGTAIANAVRLEGACRTGEVLIGPDTWGDLPKAMRKQYGDQEEVKGKRGERFRAHRRNVVNAAPWEQTTDPAPVLSEPAESCHYDPCCRNSAAGEMRRALGGLRLHRRILSRRSMVIGTLAAGVLCVLGKMVPTWTSGTPGPAVLKEMKFYVRRGANDHLELNELVVNGVEQELEPIEPPLAPEDDFKLIGQFKQPTYWYLLWFDTAGLVEVAAHADASGTKIQYPIRDGKMQSVNPTDPPGVHLLVVVAGSVPPAQGVGVVGALVHHLQGVGKPPAQLPKRWSLDLRGAGGQRSGPSNLQSDYLQSIKDRLPPGLEPVHFVFLQTKQ